MKTLAPDSTWMPAREEWDFRATDPTECDFACYWEYSRSVFKFSSDPQSWMHHKYGFSPFFMFSGGERNPNAWTTLSAKERVIIQGCRDKPTAFRIMPIKEIIAQSLKLANGNHRQALEMMSNYPTHVMWTDFARHGSEKVIDAFTSWAREAYQKCPKTLRGKAAALPFGWLKWLAAYRLEGPRREAGVSFAHAQKCIAAHQLRNAVANRNDVLPLYASHGAWSKAIADARGLLKIHAEDPMALCVKVFDAISWEAYQEGHKERMAALLCVGGLGPKPCPTHQAASKTPRKQPDSI